MSITNYSELQTAVSNWMDRTDLSSRIPECIALAEAFFNRKLRVRNMVASNTFTTTAGVATLPADFLAAINVIWTGNPVGTLEEFDNQRFQNQYGNLNAGTPSSYLIKGSSIYVAPVDNTTSLRLDYYQQIPPLSSNSTNWLLTAHPDVYLFGALAETELFTEDGQGASVWKQRRDEVLAEIALQDASYRGAAPMIRVMGPTP